MQYQNPTFDQGVRAFNAGDYEMALRSFLKLAHRGDPQSQYYLAYMYDVGHGLTSDPNEAARWYLRSAEQNYMPAVVYAGYIYATGTAFPNMDKAKGGMNVPRRRAISLHRTIWVHCFCRKHP